MLAYPTIVAIPWVLHLARSVMNWISWCWSLVIAIKIVLAKCSAIAAKSSTRVSQLWAPLKGKLMYVKKSSEDVEVSIHSYIKNAQYQKHLFWRQDVQCLQMHGCKILGRSCINIFWWITAQWYLWKTWLHVRVGLKRNWSPIDACAHKLDGKSLWSCRQGTQREPKSLLSLSWEKDKSQWSKNRNIMYPSE